MLRRQSGTLSLMKSDHPTPSHPSNHAVLLIVCVGREGKGESSRLPAQHKKITFDQTNVRAQWEYRAVSYTHLTLPTRRTV